MVIEFVGCTGAGKTTLTREMRARLEKNQRTASSIEFVTGLVGLRSVRNPTLQNVIMEAVSFPFFLLALPRYWGYFIRTLRLAARNTRFSRASFVETVNNLRSLERKLGVHEITRRFGKNWIILVDEGPILAAHMLTYHGASYTPEEISGLARRMPLPDLVVYIKAPVDLLVARTMRRPDPPRVLVNRDPAQIKRTTRDTSVMFDTICAEEGIRARLCVVDSADRKAHARSEAVEAAIRRIGKPAEQALAAKFNNL